MRHALCPSATFAVRLRCVKLQRCIPASSALERDRLFGRSDLVETLLPGSLGKLRNSPRLVLRYCKAFANVPKLPGLVSAASDQPETRAKSRRQNFERLTAGSLIRQFLCH
jgi:hypothetical protein